jgi:hypothetical protein
VIEPGAAQPIGSQPAAASARVTERHPQTRWATCNRNAGNGRPSTFRPISDNAAAQLVTRQPETRPYNARPFRIGSTLYPATNDYLPTAAQIAHFEHAHTSSGQSLVQFNPYLVYVDGRDGLRYPSTDDLIQWAAHKWGIPENWLRAEYVKESFWNSFQLGDAATVNASWYSQYPYQARVPNSLMVYESLGITQVKWIPNGSVGAGSEPLRWLSTAFNIDYQTAMVRFYYDNPSGTRSTWGDSSYSPCERWNSIGGWFDPYPWGNAGQEQYVAAVRQDLADRAWAGSNFRDWTPSSFPSGVRFG